MIYYENIIKMLHKFFQKLNVSTHLDQISEKDM